MMMQRYRYHKSDGTPVWLAFDPEFPCIYCDEPVDQLSLGGPALCLSCDSGRDRKTGKKWTPFEYARLTMHARKRIDTLPFDLIWLQYEKAWEEQRKLDIQKAS